MPPNFNGLSASHVSLHSHDSSLLAQIQGYFAGSPRSPIVYKKQSGFRRPKIPKRLAYFLKSSSPLAYPPYGWIQAIKSPNASHRSAFAVGTPLFRYTGAINDPHGLRHKVPAESTFAQQPSRSFPRAQKCRCGSQVERSSAPPGRYCRGILPSPDPMLTNHSGFSQLLRESPGWPCPCRPISIQSGIEVEAVKIHSAPLLAAPALLSACGFRSLS